LGNFAVESKAGRLDSGELNITSKHLARYSMVGGMCVDAVRTRFSSPKLSRYDLLSLRLAWAVRASAG
jgi:hypothetical protein